MSNYIVDSADLSSVANAIRTKGGTSAQLAFPAGFVSAVEAIETGGGGGAQLIASGTYTGDYTASATIPVGTKCPQTDFIMLMWLPNNTGVTQQNLSDRTVTSTIVCVNSTICFYDLSSDGTISPTYKMTVDVTQDGATATRDVVALARDYAHARKGAVSDSNIMRIVPKIIRSSSGFSIYQELQTDGRYPGATFNWQLLYYGSSPETDIVEVA